MPIGAGGPTHGGEAFRERPQTEHTSETVPNGGEELQDPRPEGAVIVGDASGNVTSRVGVFGRSTTNIGVYAESGNSIALVATGAHLAASLRGDIEVTGSIRVTHDIEVSGDIRLRNADCAENFDVEGLQDFEPGTVMVFGVHGCIEPSCRAYDKRVAGVISGGGHYKPGIVLDSQGAGRRRQPIALLGKTFCKVDASQGAIGIGDLLTSSDIPGHAMKATDHDRAFGTIIGKALQPLEDGVGVIPMLIALQ